MNIKATIVVLLTAASLLSASCKKYLDEVPADVATLQDAFKTASGAYNFMASCYGYIPAINDEISATPDVWGSDEIAIPWARLYYYTYAMVRGQISSSTPLWNFWGSGGMYDGIRQCYTFLNNIDQTPNLDDATRTRMKGDVNFLIAYLHFVLLRSYGPIVTVDHEISINSTGSDYYPARQPYDSCVSFISNKLDLAASMLPAKITSSQEYGRATSVMAKSLKARMLLYAASPLFNGNTEYYSGFKNKDGTPLMSQTYSVDKWQKAADACLDAINAATSAGIHLYTQAPVTSADPATQALYNYRYATVDPWNAELIWGYAKGIEPEFGWQVSAMPNVDGSGTAFNGVAPTLAILETYYTKNGLPINQDPAYSYSDRYKVSGSTIQLNLNREPRFYASIAYQGGVYYCNATQEPMNFLSGNPEGWSSGQNNYAPSGYLVQKMVHPNTIITSSNPKGVVSYPWPVIRLSELYLSYAEALNETQGAAQSTVLNYIDPIRQRAGIPTVADSWAMAGKTSFSQDDLRQIIRTERMIELAFEGHRMWDLRRWKLGAQYLNVPVYGMNIKASNLADFAQPAEIESRSFTTPASYLFPIGIDDISVNQNLVQNPGW